jgi:hypothetical protein
MLKLFRNIPAWVITWGAAITVACVLGVAI